MPIDLTTLNFSFDGANASFTIQNNGTDAADASVVGVFLSTDNVITESDLLLATQDTPPLASGASSNGTALVQFPTNLAPGTYHVGAFADYDQSISETNEGNNASSSLAVILGDSQANTLSGTAGDDIIVGNGGNDTAFGLSGNDTYVYTTGFDSFDGGSGTNTLNLTDVGAAVWFGFDDPSGIEAWTKGQATLTIGNWRALVDTTAVENVIGTRFDDTLKGDANVNVISGGGGNDTIIGNGGADTISGGDGDDVLVYLNTSGVVSYDGGAGSDTLDMDGFGAAIFASTIGSLSVSTHDTPNLTTGSHQRDLVSGASVENIVGTNYDDTVIFDGADNTYVYTNGLDTVDGRAGYDTVDLSRFGAAILFDRNNANGIEVSTKDHGDLTQGALRGIVDITYTTSVNPPFRDLHDGLSVEHIIGTSFDDTINADADDPQFTYSYTGGFDTYNGTGGTETLDLSLMPSAALYDPSNPNGHAIWTTDHGDLTTGTLRPIMDASQIDNVTGTPFDDTIYGDSNNNVLSGGDGNDTLDGMGNRDTILGGAGDDTDNYSVAPTGPTGQLVSTFDGGSGNDTLDLSHFSGAIWSGADPSGIEVWAKYYGSGFSTDLSQGSFQGLVDVTSVENIIGTPYDDQIYDGATPNRITGGGGGDLLIGGGGNDTYVYIAVTDSTGVGYDTINYLDGDRDKFDFSFAVTGVDGTVSAGSLSTVTFDSDLAATIGSGQLGAHHAVLFTPDAGSLAGHTFLIVDSNGTPGYQNGQQDFIIDLHLATDLASLGIGSFV